MNPYIPYKRRNSGHPIRHFTLSTIPIPSRMPLRSGAFDGICFPPFPSANHRSRRFFGYRPGYVGTGNRVFGVGMLTETEIKKTKPREKPFKLSDGGGLHLYVTPAGGKLWRYRFEVSGKEKLLSIGPYPSAINSTKSLPQCSVADPLVAQAPPALSLAPSGAAVSSHTIRLAIGRRRSIRLRSKPRTMPAE